MKHVKKTKDVFPTQSFLQGALVLAMAMGLVKVMGALFKIPLNYVVGEYGMGLFNVAYHFYGPIFSLATAGFPIAVSRMVSEDSTLGRWQDVRQAKRIAQPVFFLCGVLGMAVITALAPFYCDQVIGNPNALAPMLALAPASLFACLGAVYRGYYEGLQNMKPTAFSEIVEAAVKLVFGLSAASWVLSHSQGEYALTGTVFSVPIASEDEASFVMLALAAAGAVLGVTLGSACGALFLLLRHKIRGDGITKAMLASSPRARGRRETLRRLLAVTLPVAVGSITMNVAGLIDATFLQNRVRSVLENNATGLIASFSGMIPSMYLENPQRLSTFLYGCYTLAVTLYLLIPSFTQPFGIAALPDVTKAWAKKNKKLLRDKIETVLRVTASISIPAGIGMSALSYPITAVLYGEESSVPIVAGVLTVLGPAAVAAAICTPLSSMLQAVGRADLPVKFLLVAMGLKIAVNYWLCSIAEINIYGAAFGTLLCYLFLLVAQTAALRRVTGVHFSVVRLFFRPLCCALLCGATAYVVYFIWENMVYLESAGKPLGLAVSVGMGMVIYVTGMIILRGIKKNDVLIMPGGQKIAKMLEKRGWI